MDIDINKIPMIYTDTCLRILTNTATTSWAIFTDIADTNTWKRDEKDRHRDTSAVLRKAQQKNKNIYFAPFVNGKFLPI